MSIYEEINYISYGRELIYHFHHFIVILSYCIFLGYPHLYFYLGWASTVETTGLFVNYFLANRRLFPDSTDRIVISGALMWFSFLVFRVVSIIGCLCMLLFDIITYPEQTILRISKLFVAVMVFVILSVFLLSCFWFYKMTVGIYKALRENKTVAPEPPPSPIIPGTIAGESAIPLDEEVIPSKGKVSPHPEQEHGMSVWKDGDIIPTAASPGTEIELGYASKLSLMNSTRAEEVGVDTIAVPGAGINAPIQAVEVPGAGSGTSDVLGTAAVSTETGSGTAAVSTEI